MKILELIENLPNKKFQVFKLEKENFHRELVIVGIKKDGELNPDFNEITRVLSLFKVSWLINLYNKEYSWEARIGILDDKMSKSRQELPKKDSNGIYYDFWSGYAKRPELIEIDKSEYCRTDERKYRIF